MVHNLCKYTFYYFPNISTSSLFDKNWHLEFNFEGNGQIRKSICKKPSLGEIWVFALFEMVATAFLGITQYE